MTAPAAEKEIPDFWKVAFAAWENEIKDAAHVPGACARYILSCNPQRVTHQGADRFVCLSPLRNEKSPSFYVYPTEPAWHDFGSHETGDLLSFAKRFHGHTTWTETLNHVAAALGLPSWNDRKLALKGQSPNAVAPEGFDFLAAWHGELVAEDEVFGCATWLANLAATILPRKALDHLVSHYGLDEEFVTVQRSGYCPAGFWELATEVHECPYSERVLEATGWFHRFANGTHACAFAERIVFLYWKNSQARYAIGRRWNGGAGDKAIDPAWLAKNAWDSGKYKKLPTKSETRPWISPMVTNRILWNEDCLRRARGGLVVVTEGMTDAMILAMLGYFVISPVTIAFAQADVEHVLELLKRAQPKRVILCNDSDTIRDARTGKDRHPGLEGARKMAGQLWAAGFKAQIAQIPRPPGTDKIDLNEFAVRVAREESAA